MVPYNKNVEPTLWQWGSTSVQANVVLDQANVTFTNLDEITGRVAIRCAKAISITGIVVKLEGESKTRLIGQRSTRQDESKVELENHKILYKTLDVFPPADVVGMRDNGKGVFTLPAGNHEYPFTFKLPFNNACQAPTTTIPGVQFGVSSQGLEITKEPTRHVKKTLPPTLTGFPGEAEISYFIKVTVARQGLLKENPRSYAPFNFLPIEPPRPPPNGSQIFARQTHVFSQVVNQGEKRGKMKSLFGAAGPMLSGFSDSASITLEMRLPEPAIITCNKILPLSVLVKKLSGLTSMLYLDSLQVALIGYTKVKAHGLERVEQNTWIIMSKANMHLLVGTSSDPEGAEIPLDSSLWQQAPLPNTVAPSFETCNVSRSYQIDVRAGLSYGASQASGAKVGKYPMAMLAQSVIIPLRLDVQIFTGIAPPPEVLSRMGKAQQSVPSKEKPAPAPATHHAAASSVPTESPPVYSEAPPSYEDAIATDLPPVDGMRPAYAPPPSEHDGLLSGDSKRQSGGVA